VSFQAGTKRTRGTSTGPQGYVVAERVPAEELIVAVSRRSSDGHTAVEVARVTIDLTSDGCPDSIEIVAPEPR